MTVASTTRKTVPVIGNGVATAFPFGFKVFAKADISFITTVIATGVSTTLVLDSDYSVVLNADQDNNPGGTVTYPLSGTILPATKEAQIISNVIATQALNLPAGGGNYNAQVIEDSLDKALIVAQQLIELGNRSLYFPPIDSNSGQIPSAVSRALQTLSFDAAGNPIAAQPSNTPVSAPMQPVVSAVSLAAARAAMGVNAAGVPNTPAGNIAATDVQAALNELDTEKAPLASPALTGIPTVPTAAATTNNTQAASTGYADAAAGGAGLVAMCLAAAPAGWVLMQGGTIGNGASGGTARANADALNLFTYLYNNLTNADAPVSSGRGANAAADFAANKTIVVPDVRGRQPIAAGAATTVESVANTAAANAVAVVSNTTKWITGMPVVVSAASGYTGLVNGSFWIVRVDATHISIATSAINATNGTVVAVTGTGAATFTYTGATRAVAEKGGEDAHFQTLAELFGHTHNRGNQVNVSPAAATLVSNSTDTAGSALSSTGGGGAFNIMGPFFGFNICIKL